MQRKKLEKAKETNSDSKINSKQRTTSDEVIMKR